MTVKKKIVKAKALKKQVEKSNSAFDRMSPSEQRVEIAKDALIQIRNKKFFISCGIYCEIGRFEKFDFRSSIKDDGLDKDLPKNTELRDVLKDIPQCNVCARGALFLSEIRKHDQFKIGDNDAVGYDSIQFTSSRVIKYERKFFSGEQLSLIETAFEVGAEHYSCSIEGMEALIMADFYGKAPVTLLRAATLYGSKYRKSKDRLVAILKNIIKNKGEFVIPEKYIKPFLRKVVKA